MGRPQPLGHDAVRLADWPHEDRAALDRALVPGSPFDEGGRAATWRPATQRSLVGAYARWLGFLLGQGVELAAEAAPGRLTPERVAAYRRFLAGRCASVTVSSYLGQLHMFARDVWPERNWQWLCDIQARQARMASPVRIKAARIVPQEDLLRLGCELMLAAEAAPLEPGMPAGPRHPALVFRDGLMIALLAMRPLRERNFRELRIGVHLRHGEDGWSLLIPVAESKTHTRLSMPVPDVLAAPLEAYLARYRPLLLEMGGPCDPRRPVRAPGDALWITRCGTPMSGGALQKCLRRHTVGRFGHHVNCHLFRDCAATSLAEDHPEHVRLAADLLGHRSFRTTERHYVQANQRRALRRVQATVLGLRRAAQESVARARRPANAPESRDSETAK